MKYTIDLDNTADKMIQILREKLQLSTEEEVISTCINFLYWLLDLSSKNHNVHEVVSVLSVMMRASLLPEPPKRNTN